MKKTALTVLVLFIALVTNAQIYKGVRNVDELHGVFGDTKLGAAIPARRLVTYRLGELAAKLEWLTED